MNALLATINGFDLLLAVIIGMLLVSINLHRHNAKVAIKSFKAMVLVALEQEAELKELSRQVGEHHDYLNTEHGFLPCTICNAPPF